MMLWMDATATRLAAAAWLAGVGLLCFRWLSPLSGFYERAILADALFATAAACAVLAVVRGGRVPRVERWQLWLAAYVAWTVVAALAAPDRAGAAKTVLLVSELAVLAGLTAWLARIPDYARALARVTLAAVAVTFALAVVALVLFYAGERTELLSGYGDFEPSERYARIRAGFASAPLLASWCIAASAVLAWRPGGLDRRWQIAGQIALALLVAATLSRALVPFAAAIVIRWAAAARSRLRVGLAITAVAGTVAILGLLTIGHPRVDPTRPSSIAYEVSDTGPRREGATTSWRTFREDPLFGSGPGSYPGLHRGQPFRAHLTPLNVAATTGLPALVALAGMLAVLWRGRSRPTDVAIWSGLLALMLDGLAQDVEHFRHVWVMVGLVGATTATAGRQTSPKAVVRR